MEDEEEVEVGLWHEGYCIYPKQTGFHIIKLDYVEYVRALCFPAPRTSNLKHGELECYESTTPMPSWSSPMSACFDHLDSQFVKPQGGGNQEVGIEFMVVVNVQITVQTEKQLVRLCSKHAVLLVARCYNLCASHSNQFNTHKAKYIISTQYHRQNNDHPTWVWTACRVRTRCNYATCQCLANAEKTKSDYMRLLVVTQRLAECSSVNNENYPIILEVSVSPLGNSPS